MATCGYHDPTGIGLRVEAECSKSLAALQTRSGGNALWQDIFDLAQLHAKIEPRRATCL